MRLCTNVRTADYSTCRVAAGIRIVTSRTVPGLERTRVTEEDHVITIITAAKYNRDGDGAGLPVIVRQGTRAEGHGQQ